MSFYEPLRRALQGYARGVHRVGAPAGRDRATQGRDLPPAYRDFLLSFNGAALFHEMIVLFSLDDPGLAVPHPGFVRIGETPWGALWMDPPGTIRLVDEAAPDPIRFGSDLERWLDAVLHREALVLDKEGEFRDVFDEEGELPPELRRRRARIGRKRDPGSALYLLEEAELDVEEHEPERAQERLLQAVALDPQAGPAWELLASLRREGEPAREAWLSAAAAALDPRLRASRLLSAAEVAPQRPDRRVEGEGGAKATSIDRRVEEEGGAKAAWIEHAAAAFTMDPGLATQILDTARERLQGGDREEAGRLARRLALLLQAAGERAPKELHTALQELEQALRVRQALRVV
jgi:tetratricopeptide (TPR) repeat protein